MPINDLPALDAAQNDLRNNVHFLRAIMDMAEKNNVIARSPIYTDKGIKLVDSGARIGSRLYERLLQMPLRGTIDHHLLVDNMVCVQSIEAEALLQCKTQALIQRLVQSLGGVNRLLAPLHFLPLPASIAFKLTMMREQRPELYEHSLQMMLVALYLAVRSDWSERKCGALAAAGLLHDLGMLYMPPAWADLQHQLSPEERQQLVTHSLLAVCVLREQNVYPESVQRAVLEHHECLDGSGYPQGLRAQQISPMGQILLLAEVVSAFYEKYTDLPGKRLSLMLRMNHRRYPAELVQIILSLLDGSDAVPRLELGPLVAEVQATGALLGDSFARWDQLRNQLASLGQTPARFAARAALWLEGRLKILQNELAQAGVHPQQLPELFDYLQDDLQGMTELALLQREAVWQLDAIASNCLRRWPQLCERAGLLENALLDWCQSCCQRENPVAPETVANACSSHSEEAFERS